MAYSVTQNTTFMTAASVLQKLVSFVYFTVIARLIGVENTGVYFFAIAFSTIFAVIADFGFNSVLTRESAKFPSDTERYLSTVLVTKIFFGLVSYLLLVLTVNILNYPTTTQYLIYIAGVTMVFDNLHTMFYCVFRAKRNLVYEGIGIVGMQLITLVIGSVTLYLRWPLIWLILAYTIPSIMNTVFAATVARRRFGLRFGLRFDKNIFKTFLVFSIPLAMAGILGRLYAYSDSLLMSKMLTKQELGLWSVPYKITFAFQFIPIALAASVYPVMSTFSLENKEKISELFTKSWRYLFTIVFPLSFGLIAIAKPVMIFLYGPSYALAAPALQILMGSLIFGFLSFITGALLNATNHQKTQTSLLAAVLVVNIAINLALLPRWGIYGAALAALVSNFILCISGFLFSNKYIKLDLKILSKYFLQAFIPAGIMGVIVHYISLRINFLIAVPLGVVVYAILLFVSGGISLSLLDKIKSKVWNK